MPEARCNNRRAWRWLALLCAAAPAFAQTAVVAGQVTDTAAGHPVARVTVKLFKLKGDDPWTPVVDVYSAATDGEGRFRIGNIPPGLYSVEFSRPGFVWPVDKGGESHAPPGIGLQPGEQRTFNFQLTPGGVVSGRILDPDGDPVSHMTVQLVWWDANEKAEHVRASRVSDDRGEYRIYDVAPGNYYLKTASLTQFSDIESTPNLRGPRRPTIMPTYYPGARDRESARELKVAAGGEIAQADVHLITEGLYTVRVKVDTPIPQGANLWLSLHRLSDNSQVGMATTDHVFRMVAPGQYRLKGLIGRMSDASPSLDAYFVDVIRIEGDMEIAAPPFSPTLKVTGSIVGDSPLPFSFQGLPVNVNVDPADVLTFTGYSPKVAADGRFSIEGAGPGSYSLSLQHAGVYIKSIRVSNREFSGRRFEITGSANMTVLLATDGGRIRGGVENAAGEFSAGSSVLVYSGGTFFTLTQTDSNGRFDLKDMPPGDYRLYAWRNSDFFTNAEFGKTYEDQSVAVTVEPKSSQAVSLKAIVEK